MTEYDGLWYTLDYTNHGKTQRMKIPQGWIVKTSETFSETVSISQIIVQDPEHKWKIKEKT